MNYRNSNFRRSGKLWRLTGILAMNFHLKNLLERHAVALVHDIKPHELARKFSDDVEICLVTGDSKRSMSRSAASIDLDRLQRPEKLLILSGRRLACLVARLRGGENADQVGAQVWGNHELACGVDEGLVRLCLILLRLRARLFQLKSLLLYLNDLAWVFDIQDRNCPSAAVDSRLRSVFRLLREMEMEQVKVGSQMRYGHAGLPVDKLHEDRTRRGVLLP